MPIVAPFDPWNSPLCTCPDKYSLSPYTGCSHRCVYCYISSYIPDAFNCRPKKNFLRQLTRDIRLLDRSLPISIANSSDPYVPLESQLRLTREALRLLVKGGFKILLITKSSLVLRDIDIIKGGPCSVSVSLTTLEDGAAMKLEPLAPPPSERLKALKALTSAGVPCSVRIDPLIPGVNSDSNMLEMLVRKAWEAGVSHIVASTYKARADSFKRLISAFPEVQEKLKELYWAMGEVKGRTRYLPKKQRVSLLRELSEVVEKYGLTYATCREGALNLTTAESCDGSHLIKTAHDRLGW